MAAQSTAVMSAIEIALGIICFCLTSCKPLFKSFFRVAAAYTQRGSARTRSQSRSKSGAVQNDDIEKSAQAREDDITNSSNKEEEEEEAESSSASSESVITAEIVPADALQQSSNRDSAVVDTITSRKLSKARRDSDNDSISDGMQRRRSRIRSWDMRFYGIFNRADKPPPVITETNGISPISTSDMRFYGVEKMELMPEVASNASHEVVRAEQQDETSPSPVLSTRPTLPRIRTRDMSIDANGRLMPGPLSYLPVE